MTNIVEEYTGAKWLPQYIRDNPKVGTLAVAWAATKLTEPARLAVTIVITPSVSRAVQAINNKT